MRGRLSVALGLYAAIAVYTFGYAAAAGDRRLAQCRTDSRATGQVYPPCVSLPVVPGAFAALAWPLFWSWEAQI